MPLNLDLRGSEAKFDRAAEHIETLKRETQAVIEECNPYTVRFGEIDEKIGWKEVFLVPQEFDEPRLSAIAGDAFVNMRGVLDYIVVALVQKSGAALARGHQFPVYVDKAKYHRKVT